MRRRLPRWCRNECGPPHAGAHPRQLLFFITEHVASAPACKRQGKPRRIRTECGHSLARARQREPSLPAAKISSSTAPGLLRAEAKARDLRDQQRHLAAPLFASSAAPGNLNGHHVLYQNYPSDQPVTSLHACGDGSLVDAATSAGPRTLEPTNTSSSTSSRSSSPPHLPASAGGPLAETTPSTVTRSPGHVNVSQVR